MRVGHPCCGFHYDVTDYVLTPQDLNVMWIQSETSRVGKVWCVLEVASGFKPPKTTCPKLKWFFKFELKIGFC